jgi:hypothetical protein
MIFSGALHLRGEPAERRVRVQTAVLGNVISYLNLAASALTLSTLTTRLFTDVQASRASRVDPRTVPLGLARVVWQKFWMSFIVAA